MNFPAKNVCMNFPHIVRGAKKKLTWLALLAGA
jgi:hypothetical protein